MSDLNANGGFRTLYEYNADTRVAKVYSHSNYQLLLEVPDVSAELGTLINNVARQCYLEGIQDGERIMRGRVMGAIR